jgi:hypothetical protein
MSASTAPVASLVWPMPLSGAELDSFEEQATANVTMARRRVFRMGPMMRAGFPPEPARS